MDDFVMPLLLGLDVCSLTMSLVNVASATGDEAALADSVEVALRTLGHLAVERLGDTVVARTDDGHRERVIVAAHLDTAPSEGEPLARVEMGKLFGPGASGAKGALAVVLKAAAAGGYSRDVTFVFHAGGLGAGRTDAEFDGADFLLLAEPTGSAVCCSPVEFSGGAVDHLSARRLIELSGVAPGSADAHGFAHAASSGIPAVAFGPGDRSVAGTPGEFVPTAALTQCEFVLRQWLTTGA